MKITIDLTEAEYERFTRIFQDSKIRTHNEFVMRAVDFIDRMRSAKEDVGCKNTQATLLVRNPVAQYERIITNY